MSLTKTESKARRMIRELRELDRAVKSGRPLQEQYTIHTCRVLPRPTDYDSRHVQKMRQDLGVSQAVFADIVGVSTALVQSWEQGLRKPSTMACRLLDEINRSRDYWRGLLALAG